MSLETEQEILRESTLQNLVDDEQAIAKYIKVSASTIEQLNNRLDRLDSQTAQRYATSSHHAQFYYSD